MLSIGAMARGARPIAAAIPARQPTWPMQPTRPISWPPVPPRSF